jgi:hypothetical protein
MNFIIKNQFYPIIIIFLGTFLTSSSLYANNIDFMYNRFFSFQKKIIENTSNLSTKNNCDFFYNPINKKNIKLDYFAGYADNIRDLIRDPIEINALRAFLLRPCSLTSEDQSCGFQLNPNNPFFLFKSVKNLNNSSVLFEIELHDSAYTTSDKINRISSEQIVKSEKTRADFKQAISSSDVVIYSGHSRFGGGPDFFPEVFNKEGHEIPSYYLKEKNGLNDILDGFKNRINSKLFLLFLGSCDSKKHFLPSFKKATKTSEYFILSKSEINESDFHYEFLKMLHMLLNKKCPQDIFSESSKFEFINKSAN